MAEDRKLLQSLTVDNLKQQQRLAIMYPLIDRRLSDLLHIVEICAKKRVLQPVPFCSAMQQVDSVLGRTADILGLLSVMENEERILLHEREQTTAADALRAASIGLILYVRSGSVLH